MAANPFDLSGKVAIVTGGNTGLGLGMAKGLAAAGATIVIADRNGSNSQDARRELEAEGRKALSVTVDVTDKAQIDAMVAAVVIDLEALGGAMPGHAAYEDLLTVPVSNRDLALVVAEGVPAADLVHAAREAGAPLVRDVRVFDRYAGEQVEPGHVSLALRLSLADPGRTLAGGSRVG